MTSIIPIDKLKLDKLNRIISHKKSYISLVAVDSDNLAKEFVEYFKSQSQAIELKNNKRILYDLSYDKSYLSQNLYVANIYNLDNEKDIIDGLQFDRDFVAENKIKIIIILSRPMIIKLQEYGDLHSVVKFSYFFKDHSVRKANQGFSSGRLKRLIKQYEKRAFCPLFFAM